MMKIEKIWMQNMMKTYNIAFFKTWATQSGVGFKNENIMNCAEIWMQTINHITKI